MMYFNFVLSERKVPTLKWRNITSLDFISEKWLQTLLFSRYKKTNCEVESFKRLYYTI